MRRIDHLVVGCRDRGAGARWMSERLGVPPVAFGTHERIGTHNALWGLGSAYLEVIAIDPEGRAPDFPRWFGLDDPRTRARIAERPRLIAWVAESTDIEREAQAFGLGRVERLSRGALSWRLTLPADGVPQAGGAIPALIQWDAGSPSPRDTLDAQDLSLEALHAGGEEATHDRLAAMDLLGRIGFRAGRPRLRATLRRGDGRTVELD